MVKNSFEVLTLVINSSVLDKTGFLDLLLIMEKFDLRFVLQFALTDC